MVTTPEENDAPYDDFVCVPESPCSPASSPSAAAHTRHPSVEVSSVSSCSSSPAAKRHRASSPASPYSPASPQCPVCLDSILPTEEVQTPCGHTFCAPCLRTMLATEAATTRRMAPSGRRGRYRHWLSIQEEGGILKCPCCRQNTFPREVIFIGTHDPLFHPWCSAPSTNGIFSPSVMSIFGQTYVQVGGIGLASYHFESESDCYLSYSRAPDDWVLDDGNKPPSRKNFINPQYDAVARRFTGTVIWPIPFNGHGKWDYEMVFSKDFMVIETGGVTLRNLNDSSVIADRLLYEDHLFYENDVVVLSSIFNQTYVQGRRDVGVASYHFISPSNCYISYENAPSAWVLDNGLPPPEKVPFVNCCFDSTRRMFTGTIIWDTPFFGDTRWEYTMVFNEDFSSICGGRCCAYDAHNRRARIWFFERDLFYHIL